MKILNIAFKNINSLRDSHSIDFTAPPFTTSSLFAITGPTGSGKSTILDVISLALFNQVPRLGKISRKDILEKGAILTRNQKEAYARVTYECKSGIYTSEWSISTARTQSLRDYSMQISKSPGGELLDLKKSDVPGKNEELIGLNYNQFIKSVILAQGEFAQFLSAKKEERGELLEKITGTGIYRQLGRMAFEKYKAVNLIIQKQQDAVEVIKQNLLKEEQLIEFTKDLTQKEKTCEPLEKEIEKLRKNLELKKTITDQLKEIDTLVAEKKTTESNFKVFMEEFGPGLQNHEKLRDLAEDLRHWKRLTLDCTNLDEEVLEKSSLRKKNSEEILKCLEQVNTFTQMEVSQDKVETELENFENKVRELQSYFKEKVGEFQRLQREFTIEIRELPCKLNEKDPEATRKQLEDLKTAANGKIDQLKSSLKNIEITAIPEEKSRLKQHFNDAREAWNYSIKLEQLSVEIQKLQKEENKLTPKIKELPGEIRHCEDKVKLYREKLKNIRAEQRIKELQASLEHHRGALINGEPCPLCGSTHHPYALEIPEENTGTDQLQEVEDQLEQWTTKLHENTTSLNHYKQQLNQITGQLKVLEKENGEKTRELSQKFDHLNREENVNWKDQCDLYQSQLENLERYEKEMRNLHCVETGLPLIKKIQNISAEGKELRQKLEALYAGKDIHRDSRQLHTRWTQLGEFEKAMAKQLDELNIKIQTSRKELENLNNTLTALVIEKGFTEVSQANNALLPEPEYSRLQEKRDSLNREISKNQNSLKILNSQVERFRKEDVEQSAEELLRFQQEKRTQLKGMTQECEELRRVIKNHHQDLERLSRIKEEIAEKEKENKRWKMLDELIGDSRGKKFNDFAQDLTLSQLLQLANLRLKNLSDRYRIDKPKADEDDSLVAIDDHMGGQRRSVKTLSGGETFLLSLSMALALSDLASRNVEINSLFIDEGFGTLDPETLDQTLDTLERLQAESSKTIGIISHVDSLKERIATQIQLKRHGQGYSTLEIKG